MIEPFLSDDALIADMGSVPHQDTRLDVWWLGQSGYLIQWNYNRFLIDPYLSDSLTEKYKNTATPHVRMSRRVIDPRSLGAIKFVFSSHAHTDHLDQETLGHIRNGLLELAEPFHPNLIAPRAIEDRVYERWGDDQLILASDHQGISFVGSSVEIYPIPAAHPTLERDADGNCLCLGYVLVMPPFHIYHSGDTVVYDGLIKQLQEWAPLDLMILPINGKLGNMNGVDAARLAKACRAKLVIPCHYDMFEFNTVDPDEQFVPECQRLGQNYQVLRLGERLTLEATKRKRSAL